jgi:hypothetical protein
VCVCAHVYVCVCVCISRSLCVCISRSLCVRLSRSLCVCAHGGRFLVDLMSVPQSVRNVAVVGHLHHGKTSLLDMLFLQCHNVKWDLESDVRTAAASLRCACNH